MGLIPKRPGIRTGGWSQSGSLRVGGPSHGGPSGLNFQISFYDPEDPRQRPAGQYSVMFNVDTRALPVAFRKVNPTARVRFATEGNSVERRISLVNGTTISGVCEHIEVLVTDETQNPGGGPVPPGITLDYTVSILATPGTRPAWSMPPCLRGTALPIVVLAAGVAAIPIPDDSGVATVAIFAEPAAGGVAAARQLDSSGTVLSSWTPLTPEYVALLPQATTIQVANVGAGTVRFAVLFGVDG